MVDSSPAEGYATFSYPTLKEPTQTWYRVYGPLTPTTHALVLLHGGPGATSVYMTDLARFQTNHNQTVILYDQIGAGNSTHLREHRTDHDFWTVDLFVAELNNLLDHLKVSTFTILGHSWGGMFGAEYAIRQNSEDASRGLKRLIISNSPASMTLWVESCNYWREQLPKAINDTLTRCEDNEDYENPEYIAATIEFYKLHMCRKKNTDGKNPFPDNVMTMLHNIEADDTVYFSMNGPSEFRVIGNLKTWDVIDRLDKIRVPTLILNGEFDEARAVCVEPYKQGIKGSEWVTIEGTSHMGFVEELEKYCDLVVEWFGRNSVS